MEALVVARGWWACRVCRRGVRRPGSARAPTGRPVTGRRLGPGAAPLSAARAPGARPGRLRPCRRRRWPPDWSRPGRPARPPPGGSGRPGAGQVTALAPAGQDVLAGIRARRRALGAGQVEPAPRRPRSLGRFGPGHPLLTEDPGQGRRRGRLQAHGGHLVVHADRTVAPVPSAPGAARTSRARVRTRSGRRLGPASRTARPGLARRRGPLPPARAGARRRASCARCPARRRTSSPPRGARHRAIGRSPDGHGDQHCGSYRGSPLNPKPRVSPPGPAEPSPMS